MATPERRLLLLPACWIGGAILPDLVSPRWLPEALDPLTTPLRVWPLLAVLPGAIACFSSRLRIGATTPFAVGALAMGLLQSLAPQPAHCAPSAFASRPWRGQLTRVAGRVERVSHQDDRVLAWLRVSRSSSREPTSLAGCVVLVQHPGGNAGMPPTPGDGVSMVAELLPRARPRNLTDRFHPRRRDMPVATATLRRPGQWRVHDHQRFRHWLGQARHFLRRRLAETLSAPSLAFARALTLGDGQAVAPAERSTFRRAGAAHLLAVSGLHVALLAGSLRRGLFWLLGTCAFLRCRADLLRLSAGCAVPLTLFAGLFAGGSASALRASVTAAFHFLFLASGRRGQPYTVATLAAWTFGVCAPEEITRPGFLLSILATSALLGGSHKGTRAPTVRCWHALLLDRLWRETRSLAMASSRITLATGPVLYGWFASVPLVGVLANIFLIPLASRLWIPLAYVHSLAALLRLPVVHWSGVLFGWTTKLTLFLCACFEHVSVGAKLPPPSAPQLLAVSLGCFGLLLGAQGYRRRLLMAAVGLWLVASTLAPPLPMDGAPLQITFLDVGQGDAAFIRFPSGQTALVDGGGWLAPGKTGRDKAGVGERVLRPWLEAQGVDRIDLAVLSHAHPDHFGGFLELLQGAPPRRFWSTTQASHEAPESPPALLRQHLRRSGVHVEGPETLCGHPHAFGEVSLRVLSPCPGYDAGAGENDNSLVVSLRYRKVRILFTGDIEGLGEARLVATNPASALRADVLKVPHHGSRTSSGPSLLEHVLPTVAVASAGMRNRFGHPHNEVRQRYTDHRIEFHRTDLEGSVAFLSDGRFLWLRSHAAPRWQRLTLRAVARKVRKRSESQPPENGM